MSRTGDRVAWAALLVAVAALVVALTGGAIGLPGKKVVDRNDLKRSIVKSKHVKDEQIGLADLSPEAEAELTEPPGPRALALVLGPNDVDEAHSRGITDENIGVNNTAFCIRGIGFEPSHVQVTARSAATVPEAILDEEVACNGETAVTLGNLNYTEQFYIALYE